MTVKTHTSPDGTWSQAEYSECEKYRYFLTRAWDKRRTMLGFIMLNPSTATELANDPTIERCQRRARNEGYGGILILNLFAYRATKPQDMKAVIDPVGPYNDHFLRHAIKDAADGFMDMICGWGTHGGFLKRDRRVLEIFEEYNLVPQALAWTKDGHPKHPLYVSYDKKPHAKGYEHGRQR